MIKNPICIITARAGSKGLPDKNMLFLMGKPMLVHSIDVALDSGKFRPQDIYVSTDSVQYKNIVESMRPVNVILRPEHLATDTATSLDVLKHFLQDFEDDQVFMLLQPTSPLRTTNDIARAFELYETAEDCTSVVSFSQSDKSTNLFTTLDEKGCPIDMFGIDTNYRRQAQETVYYSNGNIYLATKKDYLEHQSFFTSGTRALVTPHESSFDVDDATTFKSVLGQIYFNHEWRDRRYYKVQQQNLLKYCKHQLKSQLIISDQRLNFLNGEHYTNVTVRGMTAHLMAENIETILQGNTHITNITLSIGLNDLICGYNAKALRQSILIIIDICKQHHINIDLMAIIYTLFRIEVKNSQIKETNEILHQLAQQYDCGWVDLNYLLTKDENLQLDYTVDGVEFNDEGQKMIEKVLNLEGE